MTMAWLWPWLAGGTGRGRPWNGQGLAGWQLLLCQRCQSGAAKVVGPGGLAGACCGTEVVLRVEPGLFRWWCCGGDGERASTMTMSGRQAWCIRTKVFTG
jgi:hypothetical protein